MDEEELTAWADENGYLTAARKENGDIVAVLVGVSNAQIIVGDKFTVAERYSYLSTVEAVAEYAIWSSLGFKGEPGGWIRHQPSNRRRTNGNPAEEYIRP